MSGDGGTILTPTTDLDVFRQAQLQALRTLSDQHAMTVRTLEKLADAMGGLREDVASLKAQNVREAVERLEVKLEGHAAASREAHARVIADVEAKFSERDRANAQLLKESLDDRKALWLAITDLKGKVIPLFGFATFLASTIMASIVAVAAKSLGRIG